MAAIINKKYNFLFIHIPKTAGRSIEKALSSVNGSVKIDLPFIEKKNKVYLTASYLERRISSSVPISWLKKDKTNKYDDLYKFCVVRDPLSRAISAYNYCMRTADTNYNQPYGEATPKTLSFSEFIRLPREFNYEIHNHFHITQSEYIKGNKTKIDNFIKMENLEYEFEELLKKLNIDNIPLPKVNFSSKNKIHIDDEDELLIKKLFEEDYKRFNY